MVETYPVAKKSRQRMIAGVALLLITVSAIGAFLFLAIAEFAGPVMPWDSRASLTALEEEVAVILEDTAEAIGYPGGDVVIVVEREECESSSHLGFFRRRGQRSSVYIDGVEWPGVLEAERIADAVYDLWSSRPDAANGRVFQGSEPGLPLVRMSLPDYTVSLQLQQNPPPRFRGYVGCIL
jgi:hypothetical protein